MPYLLAALLLVAAPGLTRSQLCKELRTELYDAAMEGYITYKEADKILRKCENLKHSGR